MSVGEPKRWGGGGWARGGDGGACRIPPAVLLYTSTFVALMTESDTVAPSTLGLNPIAELYPGMMV
jgi:hypothetical protein